MYPFPKVNQESQLSGVIRNRPEDFRVDETQSFIPSGEGEHVWLHLQKTGENTDWVAGQLARIAEVPRRDVSFAGMKDRHAVSTQWFSVQMPGREAPDWQSALPESVTVLAENRHSRKLKRGALQGNRFKIVIRDFSGEIKELYRFVDQIKEQGVPNYYGEQRFGFFDSEKNAYSNVVKAEQWFEGKIKVKSRQMRSIYLSAARSWVFNHILANRVEQGSWNIATEGDVFMLNGSGSCFHETVDESIITRVDDRDLHPTGALWGRGRVATEDKVKEIENSIAVQFPVLCNGLENKGLKQERKSLRLNVEDISCEQVEDDVVSLSFSLPAGAFATSVLNELGQFK